ncbi:MAG: DNA topoisomerase 4 subunit A [Anaerolineae bacterium]|nr:DNA topoisomerase 4 subunit A [Anaerolineae bacterium]
MAVQSKLFEQTYGDTIELYRDMTDAYIGYARETITDRALPDVRDGLKPVQRRIMFAMHELGLTHEKPHKKSARIVGEVLGKYHPHGDSSVYLAMVRMAQEFVMEAPLVDGQGNFGSIDGDSPAAMRYTEARLTALAEMMLQDLHMDTVSWIDNFDGSLQEPTVLPSIVPNLLVNGSDGIAVGMATKIPPHNLGEVCEAVTYVAKNWNRHTKINVDELLPIIPGPDFPTGGLIYRFREDEKGETTDTIRQAYSEGRGRVIMQARLMLEDIGGGKSNIIITELPYAVLKTTVIEKLAREVREGRITGITDLRDESDYTGMRVVIEVSRSGDPQAVLKDILKYSQLRETFGIINLALVPTQKQNSSQQTAVETATRPKYLSLASILNHFVEHRLEVIIRRSRFELERRKARLHIVDGLLKALDILDEVIDTIRRSRTADTARTNLMRNFKFSEIQATAILDMQLRRLAALERQRLVDEQKELKSRIKYLESLLASEKKRLEVIIDETTTLKDQFATPRKTVIMDQEDTIAGRGTVTTQADLVMPDEPQMVILTPNGIERRSAVGFSYQVSDGLSSRTPVGGGHLMHLKTDAEALVILLTNKGRAWKGGVGFIPESATFGDMDLPIGENIIHAAVLLAQNTLILGTRQGKV